MPSSAVPVVPYSARLMMIYVLLLLDVSINANADANASKMLQIWAALALAGQVVTRLCTIGTTISLLGVSGQFRDDFIIEFFGLFAISLLSMIVLLFLRVFRVTLAAFPSKFESAVDYWRHEEYGTLYCAMLTAHILLSLLYYYFTIRAAHRMGSSRSHIEAAAMARAADPRSVPTAYRAVALSSMRR